MRLIARSGGFDCLITLPALGDRAGITGAMLLAEQAGRQRRQRVSFWR